MRADFISGDLPVGENAEEDVGNIIVQCATVVGESRAAFGS